MSFRKTMFFTSVGAAVMMLSGSVFATDVTVNVIAAQYGQKTSLWWDAFEKEFEADHLGIDLVVDVVSWKDIYNDVNTRIANGEAPDILNCDVFADYQAKELLLPAKEYISEETYAKMYDSFLAQSEVNGTVWAVPALASARAMYYNVDILNSIGAEAPLTWDELKEVCQKIMEEYHGEIYPWCMDLTTDEGQAAFAYYIWNFGGDFTDEEGNWILNSEENAAAVTYMMELVNSGYTNTDPANETRYDLQDMFGAGKIAMMIAPNSLPQYCADGGYDVNYAVASIPSNTEESVSPGVMDRFMCFDNDYSEEELAAITAFFDYFYDDERYSDWVLMEGFLPTTRTGGEILAAADESMAAWVDILGSSKFYPTAKAKWADVKQGVISVEQQALLGENIPDLLDNLQKKIAG